jgi:hypothetical protein
MKEINYVQSNKVKGRIMKHAKKEELEDVRLKKIAEEQKK